MDSLFEEVGANGRFQKCNLIFLSIIQMIASMTFYVTIFNVAEPTLNCSQKVNNIEAQNSSKLRLETCDMWNNYSADKEASRYTCEFETIYYEKTIINEWGLICDKTHLAAITQTIFLIGNISAFLSGKSRHDQTYFVI